MEITDIQIQLVAEHRERILAYCTITIDGCFVVKDLKIISGPERIFVAMPARKVTARCGSCNYKNHLLAFYCNQCGVGLERPPLSSDEGGGRHKMFADIAHPINARCRDMLQYKICAAYNAAVQLASSQGDLPSESPCKATITPQTRPLRALRIDAAATHPQQTRATNDVVAADYADAARAYEGHYRQVENPPQTNHGPSKPGGANEGFGAGIFN